MLSLIQRMFCKDANNAEDNDSTHNRSECKKQSMRTARLCQMSDGSVHVYFKPEGMSDCVLRIRNTHFHCHKQILGANSEYFCVLYSDDPTLHTLSLPARNG